MNRAELSRSITEVEKLSARGREILSSLPIAEPRIIGWTGSPGAGKSSLISRVIAYRRGADPGSRIAVIAVDPSSTFTGGSVLGDRIRMDDHTLDENVYIRSLASRGLHGGLAPAAMRVARFLAAAGFSEIHLETVGAGQDDVEIREYAETVVLVSSPHAGDAIQGIKAGILEIADLYVVNKSDLSGSAAALSALEGAIGPRRADWMPPVLSASAKDNAGIEEFSRKIDDHFRHLERSHAREQFVKERRASEFRHTVLEDLSARVVKGRLFRELDRAVQNGELLPTEAAVRVLHGVHVDEGERPC